MHYIIIILLILVVIWLLRVNEDQEVQIDNQKLQIIDQMEQKHGTMDEWAKKYKQKHDELQALITNHADEICENVTMQRKYRETVLELTNLREDRQILDEAYQNTKKELDLTVKKLKIASDRLKMVAKFSLNGKK